MTDQPVPKTPIEKNFDSTLERIIDVGTNIMIFLFLLWITATAVDHWRFKRELNHSVIELKTQNLKLVIEKEALRHIVSLLLELELDTDPKNPSQGLEGAFEPEHSLQI